MSTDPRRPRRSRFAIVAVLLLLGSAPADSPTAGESGCRDILKDGTGGRLDREVETGSHKDYPVLPGVDVTDDDDTVAATYEFTATLQLAKDACGDVDYLVDLHDPGQSDKPRIAMITGTVDAKDSTKVVFEWSREGRTEKVTRPGWCVEFVARTVNDEGKVFDYSPDFNPDDEETRGRDPVCDGSEGGTGSHG